MTLAVPNKPVEFMELLRSLLLLHVGKFSNNAPAIWLQGEPFDTTRSVRGCLVLLKDDYLVRDRAEMGADQYSVTGVWEVQIIQYDYELETQQAKQAIKDIFLRHFRDPLWRTAAPIKGQYPRSIVYVEFNFVENGCP